MTSKRFDRTPLIRLILPALAVAAVSLAAAGCNGTGTEPAPAKTDTTIQFIQPVNGGTFKIGEALRVVVKCDYGKFSSGLNYQLSTDSGKTWKLMKSQPPKTGSALDTLDWDPIGDPPGDVPVGTPLLVRAIDYDKTYSAVSKAIILQN